MSQIIEHDLIVIGGGSAGYAAARTGHENGLDVAIIDSAEKLGGLCILKGCMPSKTLIYTAEILHHSQQGEIFGLDIPSAKPDFQKVKSRKELIIKEFSDYREEQLHSDRFTLYRSRAQFSSSHTIELGDGRTLRGKTFMIATGSVINTPNIPGLNNSEVLISDDILELEALPHSITVLGGGVIACELAQYLSRMGSKVTIVQRSPRILKEFSEQASSVVTQAFRDEGITVICDTQLKNIETTSSEAIISYLHKGEEVSLTTEKVLNTLGRVPNTPKLGLENAGVELDSRGYIQANEFQQTSQGHIYAGGDCSGPHEVVHVAIQQGECAINHACHKNPKPIHYNNLMLVIFTDPQLATVGLSEKQLIEENIEYVSADYPFNDHGKSILMNANYGYVKVFATKETGQIVGAECVGKDAGELIHSLSVAVTLKATAKQLLEVHWYHPTLSEIWSYPLEDIVEEVES